MQHGLMVMATGGLVDRATHLAADPRCRRRGGAGVGEPAIHTRQGVDVRNGEGWRWAAKRARSPSRPATPMKG